MTEEAPCIDDLNFCDEKELSAVLTGLLSQYGMLPSGEGSPAGESINSPYNETVPSNLSPSGPLFHELHNEYQQETVPKYQSDAQLSHEVSSGTLIQSSRSTEGALHNKPQQICEPKHATQLPQSSDFQNQSNFNSGSVPQTYSQQNRYYGVGSQGLQPSQHQENGVYPNNSGWMHEVDYYGSQSSYFCENSRVAQYKSYLPQYYPQTHQQVNNSYSQYGTSVYRAHNTSCPIGNNPHQSSWFRNSETDFNWENNL